MILQELARALGWVAVGWGALVLWLALGAWWLRARMARREQTPDRERLAQTRVLLIRPCAGDERHLRRCLESVERAHHSFQLEVVMAVDDEMDRALPMARDVAATLGGRGVSCEAVTVRAREPNRKVGILHGVFAPRAARFDVVLNADSNVDLEGYDLDRLVLPLVTDDGPGAVWAPHAEHTDVGSFGDRASSAVLNGSLHSFPLLCAIDPRGLVGKVFGARAGAIVAMGGFEVLLDYLGEDMELSRRLRKAGHRVRPIAAVARSLAGSRRLREVVARHARWMAVIRAQRPWLMLSFPLLFCGTPVMLACAAVAFTSVPSVAALGIALALAGRLLVAWLARSYAGFVPRVTTCLVDAALADFVLLAALAQVAASRDIRWRGMRLRLRSDGRIETR